MRILVIGSGAREHAIAWACHQSELTEKIICAPGNAGTASIATNFEIAATDVEQLVKLAQDQMVELAIIGSDAAVAAGVADGFIAAGIAVFGPTAAAGRIESSKAFAKSVMNKADIPTAEWRVADNYEQAMRAVNEFGGNCAVKVDGLAFGKGVTVCDDAAQASRALKNLAGQKVVIEQRLFGPEVSVFAITDGTNVKLLGAACDYKRAYDGDQGPNTGGMGSYSPPHGFDVGEMLNDALRLTIQPCIDTLRSMGTPYQGHLYVGLMLTDDGMKVIEYNARLGDPEAQVILPLLHDDVVEIFGAAALGKLPSGRASMHHGATVGVVAAPQGYPGVPATGAVIKGLDQLDHHALCFQAGTKINATGEIVTGGARALTVVGRGHNLETARAHAYENIVKISFDGMWYRKDIAALPAAVAT